MPSKSILMELFLCVKDVGNLTTSQEVDYLIGLWKASGILIGIRGLGLVVTSEFRATIFGLV